LAASGDVGEPRLGTAEVAALATPVLDCLPPGVPASAACVAWVLSMPEADAARVLGDLVAGGYAWSATGPVQ
jgi:hypothetical protein